MDGILLIDKPAGWTSFDVVNKVRWIIQTNNLAATRKKRFPVGHTGTLDPAATGLLVLLLGEATKRAPELTKLDKTYDAIMCLGYESTTGDSEGAKTFISGRQPTQEELETALHQFEGEAMQTPPAYSAVKVNGQRAYKLAREGKEVNLEARPIHVHSLRLDRYVYPEVMVRAEVSSGTYIRSLVEDLGGHLRTGAYLAALRRIQVGKYKLEDALTMDHLFPMNIQKHLIKLDPPKTATQGTTNRD